MTRPFPSSENCLLYSNDLPEWRSISRRFHMFDILRSSGHRNLEVPATAHWSSCTKRVHHHHDVLLIGWEDAKWCATCGGNEGSVGGRSITFSRTKTRGVSHLHEELDTIVSIESVEFINRPLLFFTTTRKPWQVIMHVSQIRPNPPNPRCFPYPRQPTRVVIDPSSLPPHF